MTANAANAPNLGSHMETDVSTATHTKGCQSVGLQQRLSSPTTIIIKILERIVLQYLHSQLLGAVVHAATRLTPTERKDTYIKIRSARNLLAMNAYRPLAIPPKKPGPHGTSLPRQVIRHRFLHG